MSRVGVMGMRALDQHWEGLSHGRRHPSPLLQQETMPLPHTAITRTGTCSMGSWAAGTEAEGLSLRRGMIRQGHGTSSTELLIF